jgi:predicted nuclease of predicted toxin-antitoxin system
MPKMKFLIDVGVGKLVEQFLASKGYDVKNIRDLDPRMPDHNILALALREKRIVVTMDKDFGELVYNSGNNHAGVLLLRLEDFSGTEKVKIISILFDHYSDKFSGHFCVFQNNKLRIRK